jgi:predicted dehydrogenase
MANQKSRREFLKQAGAGAAALSGGSALLSNSAAAQSIRFSVQGRVLGANDRINLGVIGVGGRGTDVMRWAMETGGQIEGPRRGADAGRPTGNAQVLAVSDVYRKRLRQAQEICKGEGFLDYREIINRKDIDAVIIATPDHWHAQMAIEALKAGKDVYLEKPMTHTAEEAKKVAETVKATGRVLQVGSQTTSSDQWWQARKAITSGMIGQLLMSQGSYHRNSVEGEWNWRIDPKAGPNGQGDDYIDWKMWLGPAPQRPYDADRFFRFRKYWDYSGGTATDLFYHVMAPLNICWGEAQFPYRVVGMGGNYVFKDGREVPDTFNLMADYSAGHSLVLSSSMANSTHIPGLIRGREGTIMIVPQGQFEGRVEYITVTPERIAKDKFKQKYNTLEVKIECERRESHMENFLRCMRSREKPVLDALTGYKALVTIAMSVQSYREGKVLYFDERAERITDRPVNAQAKSQ